MTLTPEEQAALVQATQDPTVTTTAAAQPTTAPAAAALSQGSPWDADLAGAFPDEAQRQAVSSFLGQKVQPYVTNLEQSSKAGRELIDAFNASPDETLAEVVSTLYGEDAAKAVVGFIEAGGDPADLPDPEAVQPERDPQVQALIDRQQEADDRKAFTDEFDRVKAANPNVDLDFDLFVPFVAKANNFDQAVVDYSAYLARFREQAAGTGQPDDQAAVAANAAAPAALGTGTATGQTSQPTEKEYNGDYHNAIDDWASEQAARGSSAAPPVVA